MQVPLDANGLFVLPAGQWVIAASTTCTNASPTPSANSLGTALPLGAVIVDAHSTNNTAINTTLGSFANVKTNGQPFNLTFSTSAGGVIAGGTYTAVTLDLSITQIGTPGLGPIVDGSALVKKIRPVAQTVLATYIGPKILNGGRMVTAFTTGESLNSNYFANAQSTSRGNYQMAENLAQISSDVNDAPIDRGGFAFWSPEDTEDSNFELISDLNAKILPSIIISGDFNPGNGTNFTAPQYGIVRLRVVTTFEYQTDSTAVETEICVGSQAEIDHINKILATEPHCMDNPLHLGWIADVFKKAFGIVDKALPYAKTAYKVGKAIADVI